MYLYSTFLSGVLIIHLALAVAYVVGSFVLAAKDARPLGGVPVLDVVVTIMAGIAVIGIATFFFGIVGLLTPLGFALMLAVVCAGGWWIAPRAREVMYWRERLTLLRSTFARPGIVILWLALVALSFSAAQPALAFDALFYHQVYALEWAQQHQIVVDLFRRFPYYASNWLLIYTWFEVFHLGAFAQFATWAIGALAAVLAYGLVLGRLTPRTPYADLAAACAGLPFLLSPTWLRWWDTGMNDVAIGSFFFCAVAVAALNLLTPQRRTMIASIVIIAFFLGMKPTLPFFLPLFALMIAAAVRTGGGSWRRAAGFVAILVVLASPWYLKNVIQDGDPAPPILHMALHRDDTSFTLVDAGRIMDDLRSDRSPRGLLFLPVRMFFAPETSEFREYGTTLVVLLLALPCAVLGFAVVTRRRSELALWSTALVSAYAYWILSAHYARYALLFYPLLAVFCVRFFIGLTERLRLREGWAAFLPPTTLIAALSAIVLAEPTPASVAWLNACFQEAYVNGAANVPSREGFLRRFQPGFVAEEAVVGWLDANPGMSRRVYAFRLETLAYSFAQSNVRSIGDWVGPERYADLMAAARTNALGTYLSQFDVSAVLVPKANDLFVPPALQDFETKIRAAGFRQLENTGDVDAFVRKT